MDVVFRQQKQDNFADLPEPPSHKASSSTERIEDPYFYGLENYISALGHHINSIQDNELELMSDFIKKLAQQRQRTKKDSEEAERQDFKQKLLALRKRRRMYREMERDALDERCRYLDSMLQHQQESEYLRYKLWKLKALPDEPRGKSSSSLVDWFAIFALIFQIVAFILFIVGVEFEPLTPLNSNLMVGTEHRVDDLFTFWTHISLMVFFGWGMASAWLRKYGYGAILFSFLIAAWALQWCVLCIGLFWNIENHSSDFTKIKLNFETIIQAAYGATSCIVAYGALIGKASIGETFYLALVQSFMYALNYYVNILVLDAVDPGGAMIVHTFGAFYGIGASFWLSKTYNGKGDYYEVKSNRSQDLSSSYTSDIMSLMGTLFLWVGFPSFNGALAPDGYQHRVVIITYLSLASSTIVGFIMSRILRRNKFEMRDIQFVTLTGGIAMASAHAITEDPVVGLVVGAVAAATCALFSVFIVPYMERKHELMYVTDTRNVMAIHGVAGFIGGFAGLIAVALQDEPGPLSMGVPVFDRGIPKQAGFQTAALFISIGIGFASGFVFGLPAWFIRKRGDVDAPFLDDRDFVVPPDFPRSLAN